MEDWREVVEKRELLDADDDKAVLGRGVKARGSKEEWEEVVGEEEEPGSVESSWWAKEKLGEEAGEAVLEDEESRGGSEVTMTGRSYPPTFAGLLLVDGTETLSNDSDWIITVNSSSTSFPPSSPSPSISGLPNLEYSKLQSESLVDRLLELVMPTFELFDSLWRVVVVPDEAREGGEGASSILAERDW